LHHAHVPPERRGQRARLKYSADPLLGAPRVQPKHGAPLPRRRARAARSARNPRRAATRGQRPREVDHTKRRSRPTRRVDRVGCRSQPARSRAGRDRRAARSAGREVLARGSSRRLPLRGRLEHHARRRSRPLLFSVPEERLQPLGHEARRRRSARAQRRGRHVHPHVPPRRRHGIDQRLPRRPGRAPPTSPASRRRLGRRRRRLGPRRHHAGRGGPGPAPRAPEGQAGGHRGPLHPLSSVAGGDLPRHTRSPEGRRPRDGRADRG
jgi:hypothetical protein